MVSSSDSRSASIASRLSISICSISFDLAVLCNSGMKLGILFPLAGKATVARLVALEVTALRV